MAKKKAKVQKQCSLECTEARKGEFDYCYTKVNQKVTESARLHLGSACDYFRKRKDR